MESLDAVHADLVRGHLSVASFYWGNYPRVARRLVERAAAMLAGELEVFAVVAAHGPADAAGDKRCS